jgi:hypothetical protein
MLKYIEVRRRIYTVEFCTINGECGSGQSAECTFTGPGRVTGRQGNFMLPVTPNLHDLQR